MIAIDLKVGEFKPEYVGKMKVQKFRGQLVDNYEMSKILNNYIAISY